jgi:hypothetical protein
LRTRIALLTIDGRGETVGAADAFECSPQPSIITTALAALIRFIELLTSRG